MKITVIIATFNRCASLARGLGSIARTNLNKADEWEVLVVDNNSRDQTREVVQSFSRRYPNHFRYLFEPRQGKSYALNSGIQQARGDVLAFADDDVTVDSTWLLQLTGGLRSGEWAGAGGRILPQWPCAPPTWLPEKEWYGKAPLIIFDLGVEAGPLTDPPFGTNMAFHRWAFEKYGMFRTDLGPGQNGNIRNNEDTEFGRRLLSAGERLRYEPTAVVYHSVPHNRLQKKYFLNWWFNKGRSDVREIGIAGDTAWLVFGVPFHLVRRLVFGTLRWIVSFKPSRRFAYRLLVSFLAGTILECYCESKRVPWKRRGLPLA